MDEAFVTKTLFAVVGAVWTIIMAVMGFFLRYWFTKNEEDKKEMKREIKENKYFIEDKLGGIIKDFQGGVDSIRSAVYEIKELASVVKTQFGAEIGEINRRLERKKEWLEEHDEMLEQHDRQIVEIKSDCKHHHKGQ